MPQERRRRAAAEASQGRDPRPGKQQRRAGRSFAEMLEQAVRKYQNRAIETAQVIEELIALAKEMRERTPAVSAGTLVRRTGLLRRSRNQRQRRQGPGRAHAQGSRANWSTTVRKNVTIDWTLRENVRAQMRVLSEAHPAQVRLPARQAGEGDPDGAGAGGTASHGRDELVR
jgi:type I site-specific restriction-modification system R (restriction) subunit